ncbi:MAG TPA: glycosyltransferase [Candidatus Dormibacteraeota bacterium]
MTSFAIVGHEPLEARMTGPTIRNWELARVAAAAGHQVTLAVPGQPERAGDGFAVVGYRGEEDLVRVASNHAVVQVSGYLLDRFPRLGGAECLVADLYDPFPLENLHLRIDQAPADRHHATLYDATVVNQLAQRADFCLCASERQRDYWLGWLTAVGRVNPAAHESDPGMSRLLGVVPFGLPAEPPQPGPPVFRGVLPGVAEGDFLVLWGGGIWNWFDPLTLIRAAARAVERAPRLRVVFPAAASPSPEVPMMAMAERALQLAEELGVRDRAVFFGDGWVPYDRRGQMLLEADLGVSLHLEDVETRFSFRTRVLDYLWAGLPVLTTEGDAMADLVAADDLGAVVGYGDVDATVEALTALAGDPERRAACARRSRAVSRSLTWDRVARPLLDFLAAPRQAADRGLTLPELRRRQEPDPGLGTRALRTLQAEGPAGVARKGGRFIARRLGDKK